jgi:hypothetical protein
MKFWMADARLGRENLTGLKPCTYTDSIGGFAVGL